VVSIKISTLAIFSLAALAISAFIAYDYLYVGFEMPDNYIFFGNTISTSELYHTDRFSWYTYDQIRASETYQSVIRMTTIFDNQTYDGAPALHRRDIFTGQCTPANLSQINDEYYDVNGRWLAGQIQVFDNGTLTNRSSFNCSSATYHKCVFIFPDDGRMAPRGTETITVGNATYDCDKYYMPNQKIGIEIHGPTWYWFTDSIPLPVIIQPVEGDAVFELVDWG